MELATFDDYVALFGQPGDAQGVRNMLTLVNQAVSDRIIREVLADWAAGGVPAGVRLLVLKTTRTLASAPDPGVRSESLGGYSVGYHDPPGLAELLDDSLLYPYTGAGRAYSVPTPAAYAQRPWRFVPEMPTTPRGERETVIGWPDGTGRIFQITGYDGPYTPVYEAWPPDQGGGSGRTRRG